MAQSIDARAAVSFPWGTLAVNVCGCFAAGFLFYALEAPGAPAVSAELRLALFTGFLGGFTTFSAFALQTLTLARGGQMSMAAVNVLASNIAGLAMVWLGAAVSRGVR
jgi:CrcB protein